MRGCSVSQVPPTSPLPGQDVEHAIRQAGLGVDLGQFQGGQRR